MPWSYITLLRCQLLPANIFVHIFYNIFFLIQRSEECDQTGGFHHEWGGSETPIITSDIIIFYNSDDSFKTLDVASAVLQC